MRKVVVNTTPLIELSHVGQIPYVNELLMGRLIGFRWRRYRTK